MGCRTEQIQADTSLSSPTEASVIIPTAAADSVETGTGGKTCWISEAAPLPVIERSAEHCPGEVIKIYEDADLWLTALPVGISASEVEIEARWVYALATAFPSLLDDISFQAFERLWLGQATGELSAYRILLTTETMTVMKSFLGTADRENILILPEDELLEYAWTMDNTIAILPFESLTPRWKVISVDGISPYDQDFDMSDYVLSVNFGWIDESGFLKNDNEMPLTNRDPEKFTSIILTGTTALARNTAYQMEVNGIYFPANDIRDWLRNADITHISNEVPFYTDCPPANPPRLEARFCSDPAYYDLLEYVGADLIELTGNHIRDWGQEALEETLNLYHSRKLPYYGGGEDLEDARKPVFLEHHGNKFVFLGCNMVGPESVWATDYQSGALPCDLPQLKEDITKYQAEGYLPIFTFQHIEMEDIAPHSTQIIDFTEMAEAGAVIVSGSQAHFAQTMAFVGDRFIHYGLGNLFFDQMYPGYRRLFIDRHLFYDGKYLGTQIFTAMLEDEARPRPMTAQEREAFLSEIFEAADW
jgi:poly-gamma-glutamate synthesis protein (capsule biosynthesis protein)